jgi:hypothetical protein
MTGLKRPNQDTGLENLSVNSSRRSGVKEDGTGNPAHQHGKHNPTESVTILRVTRPDRPLAAVSRQEVEIA